ncbi:hypothetical protein [Rhodospirillaceae bacterium SYSU D60014]|uniref:hypothetical protein n=1 Tax=Virgifigura deserti TaxID=2268457 RepID=UPI0013C4B31D
MRGLIKRTLSLSVPAMLYGVLALPVGAANLLTKAVDLEPLSLSAGKAFPKEPIELEAGQYYRWEIESDGTSEMAIAAPNFFRFIGIEVRPLGLDSIEFDEEGTATISFVPIRPGPFEYFMPNTRGDTYRGTIIVK